MHQQRTFAPLSIFTNYMKLQTARQFSYPLHNCDISNRLLTENLNILLCLPYSQQYSILNKVFYCLFQNIKRLKDITVLYDLVVSLCNLLFKNIYTCRNSGDKGYR